MLTVTHLAENFKERVSNDTVYQTVSIGQTPSRDRVLTRVRIFDLDDKPLEGEVVKAALYRMRDRWSHKVIVTDQTGSMYPYVDQVTLWHALQLSEGSTIQIGRFQYRISQGKFIQVKKL